MPLWNSTTIVGAFLVARASSIGKLGSAVVHSLKLLSAMVGIYGAV
jgi:hypothetical protein